MNQYDAQYDQAAYYWGVRPSAICFEVLKLMPPDRPLRLLDIGCGEGRNAVFFARNGYDVSAFDLSAQGVTKTLTLAERCGVRINAFQADLLAFRLADEYDILFSTGVLHYIPAELRGEVLGNYKQFTRPGGLDVFSVFVRKPFIGKAPDREATAHTWISGELFTHYHDWRIEFCTEQVFDCTSGGTPHQHAVNRMVARKEE